MDSGVGSPPHHTPLITAGPAEFTPSLPQSDPQLVRSVAMPGHERKASNCPDRARPDQVDIHQLPSPTANA